MKKNQISKIGQGFRNATIIATLWLAFSVSSSAKPFDEKEPDFKAVVFKKENKMVFKAIAKDINGSNINLKIKNEKGIIFYEERYCAKKTYNRDFNVADLEPGKYYFEISNGKKTYEQHFEVFSNNTKEIVVK